LAAQAAADSSPETEIDGTSATLPDELPVDSAWDDIYESSDGSTSYSRGEEEEWDLYERYAGAGESLRDYLYWQMRLTPFSDQDLVIATAIIDAIDESGYLTLSLEEICQGLQDEIAVTPADAEPVLTVIQHFDPQGVGARGPAECLLLQLEALPKDTPWLTETRRLIELHLELLGLIELHLELLADRDFNGLMRRLKVSREALQSIVSLIQSLNPHPGERLSNTAPQYIVPDVLVSRSRAAWRVELNPESTPKLRINSRYAALVRQTSQNGDVAYLKNHLQEANWFLKSLQNRNETLLKVATCIVERQREFLERGDEHMKPLILRDIAEELGMPLPRSSACTNPPSRESPPKNTCIRHAAFTS